MPFLFKKKSGDGRIGMKYHREISKTKNTVKAPLTIPNSLQETCFANHSANFLYLETSLIQQSRFYDHDSVAQR